MNIIMNKKKKLCQEKLYIDISLNVKPIPIQTKYNDNGRLEYNECQKILHIIHAVTPHLTHTNPGSV